MHGTWEICSKVAIFRGETKRVSEINTLRFQFQLQKLINLRYQFMELKNSTALRFMHRPRLIYLTISIFFLSICALLTSISSTRTACLGKSTSIFIFLSLSFLNPSPLSAKFSCFFKYKSRIFNAFFFFHISVSIADIKCSLNADGDLYFQVGGFESFDY